MGAGDSTPVVAIFRFTTEIYFARGCQGKHVREVHDFVLAVPLV